MGMHHLQQMHEFTVVELNGRHNNNTYIHTIYTGWRLQLMYTRYMKPGINACQKKESINKQVSCK